MKILFDECMPRQLKRDLSNHEVRTVAEMGWSGTRNGILLRRAETQFDVMLTVDQHIPQQQNMDGLQLALIVLIAPNNKRDTLRLLAPRVLAALATIQPGDIVRITA